MIELYQESVPFSNKMYEGKISSGNTFTNPVTIPYALNSTLSENVIETVIYIRNNDQSKFYKNVTIALMKEDTNIDSGAVSGRLDFSGGLVKLSVNGYSDKPAHLAMEYPGVAPTGDVTLSNAYRSNYQPVSGFSYIDVKFSYGYDELSNTKWDDLSSIMIIPYIGTTGGGDTSLIPIRMRIILKEGNYSLTNRDFFIDVSYSDELNVGSI